MNLRDLFSLTNWWGKLLGLFFGYLAAGPLGAFFGVLIGNLFDKGLTNHFSNPHWLYHAENREMVQKIFFETTFYMLGYFAKIDGRVSESEIQMANDLMKQMRLNTAQRAQARHFFNLGKQKEKNTLELLTQLKTVCIDNHDLLKLFVDIQYRAIRIDVLTEQKIQAFNALLTHLGFAPLYQQYRFYEDFSSTAYSQRQSSQSSGRSAHANTSAPSQLAHAYALMEISTNASHAEVKRAYRKLLSRNHPDKLIAQGLPEQMIKLANDKTYQLRKAYELICAHQGWTG